jgi:rfaE bifunctional protein nucleotidyltransferase chain/domain
VWVNGCFDLLHCGHLRTIRLAASAGDCLIIGLNSDFSVRKLKGFRRPIIDEMNRARALSEIPGVNFVLIFNEESPLETLKKFEPQIVVKGAAYSGIEFPEKEYLESIKCEIRYLPQLKGISSTEIERQILRADEKDF